MGTTHRMIATVLAGVALLATSAGACGPTEQDGDDGPGVTNQQPGGDGREAPDDDGDGDGGGDG